MKYASSKFHICMKQKTPETSEMSPESSYGGISYTGEVIARSDFLLLSSPVEDRKEE